MTLQEEIKDLQKKAGNYQTLRGFVDEKIPRIIECLQEATNLLNEIRPGSMGARSTSMNKKKRLETINQVYEDLVLSQGEKQVSMDSLESDYGLPRHIAYQTIQALEKKSDIHWRKEGRTKFLFHHGQ